MSKTLLDRCARRQLALRGDERGSLVAIEGGRDVPFRIARVYYVFGTKEGVDRGFHAHRVLQQFAVPVSGSCIMILDDGEQREEVLLDDPTAGLQIPPMIWHEMRAFSPDCVLMVLADAPYEEEDYIRNYAAFLEAARQEQGA
jgi:dTDP-4-dehydrorhamnose 3,5-epimerase-like enzyme